MGKAGQRYLENLVGISLVYLEAFDGYEVSLILSVGHIGEPAVATNPANRTYKILPKKVRRGYNAMCFANFGKESQTSSLEFVIEA